MIISSSHFIPFCGIYRDIAYEHISQSLADYKMTNSGMGITESYKRRYVIVTVSVIGWKVVVCYVVLLMHAILFVFL